MIVRSGTCLTVKEKEIFASNSFCIWKQKATIVLFSVLAALCCNLKAIYMSECDEILKLPILQSKVDLIVRSLL